ncbi:MAG: class I SAM-dependent methyltransferase [Treponemataceae bacterium]|nr:class I SAM-dependent methyltransferase [Treponemataceae bacterium]
MGQLEKIAFENQNPLVKERVVKYWARRSESFYQLRKDELGSDKSEKWLSEISTKISELGLDFSKNLSVLDLGCGAGFFEILLASKGCSVSGIDLTREMVDKANMMIRQNGLDAEKVHAVQMDAEKLNFEDESFDIVISRNLTWTLPHPTEAYKDWYRVLKKGGILLNFDAEYAKGAHDLKNPENMAHRNISDSLKDECHSIYHMLTVSTLNRPEWDCELLKQIGFKKVSADMEFGNRIYDRLDEFYIPERMFMISAVK